MKILVYIWQAFSLTLNIFFTLFLPIIISCIILNIIAVEQNKRLYNIAGWNGLLLTAWIGTPVHELSHLIATFIAGHKVTDVKLFKPNLRTGTMGYVTHTYNSNNFYQAVIGNTMIAIAPFFGGALAIYMVVYFLLPGFSLYAPDVPRVYYITSKNYFIWKSYLLFGETTIDFFKYLFVKIANAHLFSNWKFYVFIFILFGIANHLSPSASDFKNFWQPLVIIILFITLLNLIILPFTKNTMTIIQAASKYVLLVMPILLFAILISAGGLLVTYVCYFILSIFKG